MESRLGFVGIVIEDRFKSAETVNHILSDYGENIRVRVGMPYKEKYCSVITLVVDMTTDEIGGLTGKLGVIEGIEVKAALAKNK